MSWPAVYSTATNLDLFRYPMSVSHLLLHLHFQSDYLFKNLVYGPYMSCPMTSRLPIISLRLQKAINWWLHPCSIAIMIYASCEQILTMDALQGCKFWCSRVNVLISSLAFQISSGRPWVHEHNNWTVYCSHNRRVEYLDMRP